MRNPDRRGILFWMAFILLAGPPLYVLSFAPAQILLVRQVPIRPVYPDGTPRSLPPSMSLGPSYDLGLFPAIYAPLLLLEDTPAWELLTKYADLFTDFIPFDESKPPETRVVILIGDDEWDEW